MFGVFDAHPMTLKGLRATGPPVLPAPQLLTMGLHVLDGLLFLQANRIAHCDVKDDNVLVDECNCCYIADLGEAIELVRRLLYYMPAAQLARMSHARVSRLFLQPADTDIVRLRNSIAGNQVHRAPEVIAALRPLCVDS
jgi:serine/threonine protein kinase